MSYVTTVMIQFDALGDKDRDEAIPDLPSDFKNTAKVQAIAKRLCEGQSFKKLKNWGGSREASVDDLYGAGFNYFPLDEFVEEIEKLDWAEPSVFQMFVREENYLTFGVWMFDKNKKLREVIAPVQS